MDKNQVDYAFQMALLIQKQLAGTLRPDEREALEQWCEADPRNKQFVEEAVGGEGIPAFEKAYFSGNTVDALQRLKQRFPVAKRRGTWQIRKWLPYAAALLVFAILGSIWVGVINQRGEEASHRQLAAIAPGGNRATLTLADGRSVRLSEQQAGIVVGDGISYLDGSKVTATPNDAFDDQSLTFNSITTPKGGTYRITLADGTQVWLNAESVLTYPSRFANDERAVEVAGEAYFAVTKDADRPFKVVSAGQTVEVLGTEFNVSAYPDAAEKQTTLVEGSVVVLPTGRTESPIRIKPGQQVRVGHGDPAVLDVDVAPYTAWKDGYFVFNGTALVAAMQQVGRWYDLEIQYEGNTPNTPFYGKISRQSRLSDVLDILKAAEVKFRLAGQDEGKRILVLH